jgi:hypothetical protein
MAKGRRSSSGARNFVVHGVRRMQYVKAAQGVQNEKRRAVLQQRGALTFDSDARLEVTLRAELQ